MMAVLMIQFIYFEKPFIPGNCKWTSQSRDVIKLKIQPRQKSCRCGKEEGAVCCSVTVA